MAKQLLVVDDDTSLLLAVSETLRAEGYEVQTARRGNEAMIRVAESLPDLIISDIRMPGMDGYALVRNLRASPRTRLVPIVFLTAKDETTDRIAGFRSGVDAYVTKPFEPEELVAIVKRKKLNRLAALAIFRFGAAECWSPALDARTTLRCRHWPASLCLATYPRVRVTGTKMSSIRR